MKIAYHLMNANLAKTPGKPDDRSQINMEETKAACDELGGKIFSAIQQLSKFAPMETFAIVLKFEED